MNKIVQVRTVDDVRQEFTRRGISVGEWARQQGVSAALTYRILGGSQKVGVRGQSHRISVLLGLKEGVADELAADELQFVRSPRDDGQTDEEGARQAQPA